MKVRVSTTINDTISDDNHMYSSERAMFKRPDLLVVWNMVCFAYIPSGSYGKSLICRWFAYENCINCSIAILDY